MITAKDITEKLSLPKFDLPKVGMPKVGMPRLDLTNFDLSKVDLSKVDLSRATDFARDAAYVGVGAVVISVRTIDEQRRAATGQITGQFRKVVGTAA